MTTPPATTIPTANGEAPAALSPGDELDVLVVGAGGAGLSAAVFAAIAGLRTAVIERTEHVGGTTAFTAGTTWVPGTHHAEEVGAEDTRAQARAFLDAAVGSHSPAGLRQRFLDLGPEAVTGTEAGSHVPDRARALRHACPRDEPTHPPGARLCGRALEPPPFDGTLLGQRLSLVRDPLPEFTVFDGMSLERDDIGHLLGTHPQKESRAHLLALRRAYRDAFDE